MNSSYKNIIYIFWPIAVLFAYFTYFPFAQLLNNTTSSGAQKIFSKIDINHIGSIFIMFLYILSSAGWGKVFWHEHHLSHLERFLFSTGTGVGVLSFLIFVSSSAGIISKMFYFLILLSGIALLIISVEKSHFHKLKDLKYAFLIVLLPSIITLVGALAPPTQYDSLVYHLALPKYYIQHGSFYRVDSNFFFAFPQNMEMLFMSAMVVENEILANLVHWIFFPLIAFAVYAYAKRFIDNSGSLNFPHNIEENSLTEGSVPKISVAALIACTVWIFTPAAMFLSTGTFNDLALTFVSFLAFYSIALWYQLKSEKWLIYCSILCAVAIGIKYTAAAYIVIFALLIIYNLYKTKQSYKYLFYYFSIIFILFLPWLIKNYLFLNNPIAPWGTSLFKNSLITPFIAKNYFSHIASHGISLETVSGLISLPWDITTKGVSYGGAFDIIGPLFLLFIPLLFLKRSFDKMEQLALVTVLLYFVIWIISGKVLRFLLPIIPILCVLSAISIKKIADLKIGKYLVIPVALLALFHNYLMYSWVMSKIDPYSVVFAAETKDQYLGRKINSYNAVLSCIRQLPSNASIISIGETRSFYIGKNNITPTVFDEHPLIKILSGSKSVGEVETKLRKLEITHVFVNSFEADRLGILNNLNLEEIRLLQTFLANAAEKIFQDKYCSVYRLK